MLFVRYDSHWAKELLHHMILLIWYILGPTFVATFVSTTRRIPRQNRVPMSGHMSSYTLMCLCATNVSLCNKFTHDRRVMTPIVSRVWRVARHGGTGGAVGGAAWAMARRVARGSGSWTNSKTESGMTTSVRPQCDYHVLRSKSRCRSHRSNAVSNAKAFVSTTRRIPNVSVTVLKICQCYWSGGTRPVAPTESQVCLRCPLLYSGVTCILSK